ncbi:uncharacterized protein JCM6883_000379 [Sporobolomyces salmoneus]|uniref:uncharacterized protein n=1 Tax=Sporobolomyces salmoneus TaxID=183962 RepID=UPI003173CC2C
MTDISSIILDLDLNGDVRTFDLPLSPTPIFVEFCHQVSQLYNLTPRGGRVSSFVYDLGDFDGEGGAIEVSSQNDFFNFLSYYKDSGTTISVKLRISTSDGVVQLLRQVETALKADHTLAASLEELIDEVCASSSDQPRDSHRPPSPGRGRGRGHGRGRGGPGQGRGGHRRRESGRGPHDHHHCRKDFPPGHDAEHNHDFPPFPPHDHTPSHFHHLPPPPSHDHFPPPPPTWNVERVIRERWTAIPEPPPFHGPGRRGPAHHHGPGGRGMPSPPHPGFEGFPPPRFDHYRPEHEHFDRPPPPTFRHEHTHMPPPPPPHHCHCHCSPEVSRPEGVRAEKAEDWDSEFEGLKVC